MTAPTQTFTWELNRLAGSLVNGHPTLAAQGAANKWAGTSGLGLQGALNHKAGIIWPRDFFAIRRVCNQLADTINEDPAYALSQIPTPVVTGPGGHAGDVPDATWTKADIVAWLLDRGVDIAPAALMHLTRDELLDLVADLIDAENEELP
jgi:hypothetical protein